MKTFIHSTWVFLLCCGQLLAQPGTLDATFGNNGILYLEKTVSMPPNDFLLGVDKNQRPIALQPVYGDSIKTIFRFLENGSLDADFGQNGAATIIALRPVDIFGMIAQEDNKILVTGSIRQAENMYRSDVFVARISANGEPDLSFGNQGMVMVHPDSIAVGTGVTLQPDGKILVTGYVGYISWGPSPTDVLTMRLLPDGTLDDLFGNGGIVVTDLAPSGYDTDLGFNVYYQPDGNILVTGRNGTQFNGVGNLAMVRYLPDGTLDPSFGTAGVVTSQAYIPRYFDVFFKDDQSFLVAGAEGDVFGGGISAMLRQYSPDGHLDADFAENGIYQSLPDDNGRAFNDVAVQSDGKIVTAGNWAEIIQFEGFPLGLLMRFLPNGTVDSTFGTAGMALLPMDNCAPAFHHFWFSTDQKKITVLGTCNPYTTDSTAQIFLARYNNDVSSDLEELSFNEVFKVFPNPATDVLVIQSTNGEAHPNARLRLLDTHGKVVFEKTGISSIETWYTAEIPVGLYFLEMMEEGRQMVDKILIVR
jgi:uncharacterized delta-60 repeat protein